MLAHLLARRLILTAPGAIAMLVAAFVPCSSAADLHISRPVRSWEFVDAVGPKAALLGKEDGTLEAYVYPLKIFKELQLSFYQDGRVIAASSLSLRISSRPGSYSITYASDNFRESITRSSISRLSPAV